METLVQMVEEVGARFDRRPALMIRPSFRTRVLRYRDLRTTVPRVARALAAVEADPARREQEFFDALVDAAGHRGVRETAEQGAVVVARQAHKAGEDARHLDHCEAALCPMPSITPRMPVSSAMREARPLSVFGTSASQSTSFFRWMTREALTPQVWQSPGRKRSSENGIRISTVQPASSTLTADSQTASHEWSLQVSLKMISSLCTPAAVTLKTAPVR